MSTDTLGARLRAALELADAGVDLMRQNLRRAHPEASAAEIDAMLIAWLDRRTGAGTGDCPGPRRGLDRR